MTRLPHKRHLERPSRHHPAPSVRATLSFDWGSVHVTDSLVIGGDSEHSPIAVRVAHHQSGSGPGRHAEVYLEKEILFVRDVGSMTGTFVNGRRVARTPQRLNDGDRVTFSHHLVAIVRLRRR
jgi:FHA domain